MNGIELDDEVIEKVAAEMWNLDKNVPDWQDLMEDADSLLKKEFMEMAKVGIEKYLAIIE